MKVFIGRLAVILGFTLGSTSGFATVSDETIPQLPNNLHCVNAQKEAMPYNPQSVIGWKSSTQNSFKARGFVQGKITNIYPIKENSKGDTHTHFAIDIDQRVGGDIEIIFNDDFGPLPSLKLGMMVVACGDYITANSSSSQPSPMGAIIHWVHFNPGTRDNGVHPGGFILVNNMPYGFTLPEN